MCLKIVWVSGFLLKTNDWGGGGVGVSQSPHFETRIDRFVIPKAGLYQGAQWTMAHQDASPRGCRESRGFPVDILKGGHLIDIIGTFK